MDAYSELKKSKNRLKFYFEDGGRSSMVEHRAVAPGVAGSSPVDLPRYYGGGKFRGRLTGRTWDFDSQNRGSNPRPGIFY